MPRAGLKGKDATGSLKTASATEYPTALAAGIALTVIRGLQNRWEEFGPRFSADLIKNEEDWLATCGRISERITQSRWLPDYQG